MKPLELGPIEETNEKEIDDIDLARSVIKLLKVRVEELKEEVEDVKLEMKDEEQRRG